MLFWNTFGSVVFHLLSSELVHRTFHNHCCAMYYAWCWPRPKVQSSEYSDCSFRYSVTYFCLLVSVISNSKAWEVISKVLRRNHEKVYGYLSRGLFKQAWIWTFSHPWNVLAPTGPFACIVNLSNPLLNHWHPCIIRCRIVCSYCELWPRNEDIPLIRTLVHVWCVFPFITAHSLHSHHFTISCISTC